MKIMRFVGVPLLFFSLFTSFCMEAHAVRPPLKPLNREEFQKMTGDADVIAAGVVHQLTLSKTSEPPLEAIRIHAVVTADRILKGDKSITRIEIEESYKQFAAASPDKAADGSLPADKSITARTAGPSPPVGRYREGDRILVFLKSVSGSTIYRPLGSGNHDAYLGVFQVTAEGVKSDRFQFDDEIKGYGRSEADFIQFIISNQGERR